MAVPREVLVRLARKDGRRIAVLRAIDRGDSYVVEAEVFARGLAFAEPLRPGPYTFADLEQATDFIDETVRSLMYLGCEIQSS